MLKMLTLKLKELVIIVIIGTGLIYTDTQFEHIE